MRDVLDEATIGALRSMLLDQRHNLQRELEQQGADAASDELAFADDAGFADRSHSTEERSQLISVVEALRSSLRDVERALHKMDSGTYGICESCGNPIAAERLEALPWALLCMDCKQKGAST